MTKKKVVADGEEPLDEIKSLVNDLNINKELVESVTITVEEKDPQPEHPQGAELSVGVGVPLDGTGESELDALVRQEQEELQEDIEEADEKDGGGLYFGSRFEGAIMPDTKTAEVIRYIKHNPGCTGAEVRRNHRFETSPMITRQHNKGNLKRLEEVPLGSGGVTYKYEITEKGKRALKKGMLKSEQKQPQ